MAETARAKGGARMNLKESEEKLLACILQNPLNLYKLSILPDHFFYPETRRVFKAMQSCVDMGIAIDYISIPDRDTQIDRKYAPMISDLVINADNWKQYQDIVIAGYQDRMIKKLGVMLSDAASTSTAAEKMELAQLELLRIAMNSDSRGIKKLGDYIGDALHKIEERSKNKGKVAGLTTGLSELDFMIGGFQPSQMIVIGARPSQGKSALGLNMACHLAITENTPIGFISAESSGQEVTIRALMQRGHVSGKSIRSGFISQSDIQKLVEAGQAIKAAPFYIHDAPNLPFAELKTRAREMVISHKIKCLFVDYLQIVEPPKGAGDQRHEQIRAISMGLKQLARELDIPLVVLAQLRRDAENKEPDMADLADSSQIEKDADVIIMIQHQKENENESRLLVKKARDAETGSVAVTFKREYVKFYQIDKQADR
jgi:replicative DNA helicase